MRLGVCPAHRRGSRSAGARAEVPAAALPTAADSAVLNHWNLITQAETIRLRPTVHGQTRGIAMVQGAIYDSVNAIEAARSDPEVVTQRPELHRAQWAS